MRTTIALILVALLASCSPSPRASVLTSFYHLKPLSLGAEQFRMGGGDTLFVTCGPEERARGAAAVIAPILGGQTARPLTLPDTGCLLWIVLATYPTLPATILADSLELRADTALVLARFDVSHGAPSPAVVRPGIVLQAPSRVTHVRLELQTRDGLRRLP